MTGTGNPVSQSGRSPAGRLVLIVGPSGSGKDTLINWLRKRLAAHRDIKFVRRTVTRKADTALEDHDTLDEKAFARAKSAGQFAATWQAHGLHYALPATARDHIWNGGIAIANGSRKAIPDIREKFGNVQVIQLTVDQGVLRRRLAGRGRDNPGEIAQRLSRASIGTVPAPDCHVVDNSGPVERAGQAVLQLIDRTD